MPRRRNRRRRTAVEMRSFIAAWKKSGLTQREFASREGLPLSTLTWWRRRLKDDAEASSRPALPVPVEILPRSLPVTAAAVQSGSFEVELRSGHLLRVPFVFDVEVLGRLVSTLESV